MDSGNHLDLNQLRAFHSLAQTGSFTATARRLFRTQSAISHAIRRLEESAGVVLVERLGRGIQLTDEGRRLFRTCESVFASLDSAHEELQRGKTDVTGRLRLGATVEFGCSILMKHIRPFLAAHPGIEMDFTLSNALLGPLLRDDIDMAIDCWDHPLPQLRRSPLFRETYLVVASPAFRRAHRLREPGDLARCPLLSMDKEGAWWNRFLAALPQSRRPEIQGFVAVNHIRAMINAAVQGMGVALAPQYSLLGELKRRDLVPLFPSVRPAEDRFYLYQKKAKADLAKHRLLAEYLHSLNPAEFAS